jgi:hypothetical protein
MSTPLFKNLALLALLSVSLTCFAQDQADPPARVGRISLVQGQVDINSGPDGESNGALLNWPVTSNNEITTAPGARAEFRVGSTAVRLDGDSALEITELDDQNFHLRLHYGSVAIRVLDPGVLPGFDLSTPQGHVRMQETGRVRVDAELVRDTSVVKVFDGSVQVDSGGDSLIVRAGKRAEIHNDDVQTGQAGYDNFDDWVQLRDQHDDRMVVERHVSPELTGYEELDQHGTWSDSVEYGSLWVPNVVAAGWAPYRDGRWAWVQPWGWTWVDNAPWGYAPFHYGRWVFVAHRWCWTPGRYVRHPVWAPALVGWVGGNGWQVNFSTRGGTRAAPAVGWYPLSPHEAFVPSYHARPEHIKQINIFVRADNDGRHRDDHRDHHEGVTVIPHAEFGHRAVVAVTSVPRATEAAVVIGRAPAASAPQAPPVLARVPGVPRGETPNARRWERDSRPGGREERPATVLTAPPARQTIQVPAAPVAPRAEPTVVPHRYGQSPDGSEQRGARPATVLTAPPAPAPAQVPATAPAPARAEPSIVPRRNGQTPDGADQRGHRPANVPPAPPAPVTVQPVMTPTQPAVQIDPSSRTRRETAPERTEQHRQAAPLASPPMQEPPRPPRDAEHRQNEPAPVQRQAAPVMAAPARAVAAPAQVHEAARAPAAAAEKPEKHEKREKNEKEK